MPTAFEDKYLDVLQNIEYGLLSMVKDHPQLCDHDMLRVIEQALIYYKSRPRESASAFQHKLAHPQQEIFSRVITMCDWRLGLRPLDHELQCTPISEEELLLCLKRIEKSIKFWTKQGGRRGYITFAEPRALV